MKAVAVLALAACGHIGFDPVPIPDAIPDAIQQPCLATMSSAGALSGAGDPACVLRNDGHIACWGGNSHGELGIGTMDPQLDPVLAQITDAIGLGAGEFHTCAIARDTTAACWGLNDLGQVGDGTISTRLVPTPVYMASGIVQIVTGQYHTCARHSDGHVSCWGRAAAGAVGSIGPNVLTPTAVAGIANVTKLTLGDNITCALTGDQAQCWGDDLLLGDGSMVDRATPGPVSLPAGRVIDIAAGCDKHVCALMDDGSAWCWGNNTAYELGDGTQTMSRVPVRVLGNASYTRISVGAIHSCGLDVDGSIWCWGSNASHQIDEAAVSARSPRRIVLPVPAEQVEAGCARTCARAGDHVWCWGNDDIPSLPPQPVHEVAIPCPTI